LLIVGQKRRIAPAPMTHDHAEPRFQVLFRTRTGEMSAASPAPAAPWPLLTRNLGLRPPQFNPSKPWRRVRQRTTGPGMSGYGQGGAAQNGYLSFASRESRRYLRSRRRNRECGGGHQKIWVSGHSFPVGGQFAGDGIRWPGERKADGIRWPGERKADGIRWPGGREKQLPRRLRCSGLAALRSAVGLPSD
jgi:hypothetical protein